MSNPTYRGLEITRDKLPELRRMSAIVLDLLEHIGCEPDEDGAEYLASLELIRKFIRFPTCALAAEMLEATEKAKDYMARRVLAAHRRTH